MRFKHERDKMLFLSMNPIMISLMFGFVIPCSYKIDPDYEITITRTIDEKIAGESVSNSHAEKRAIDIRIYDMPEGMAKALCDNLNSVLSRDFGAFSFKDGKPRFAVLEEDHIHLQIRSNLSFNAIYNVITRGILYTHLNKNTCSI